MAFKVLEGIDYSRNSVVTISQSFKINKSRSSTVPYANKYCMYMNFKSHYQIKIEENIFYNQSEEAEKKAKPLNKMGYPET